ncbi:MAG: ABC transporter substrate-binding protein [Microbacterium sp.]
MMGKAIGTAAAVLTVTALLSGCTGTPEAPEKPASSESPQSSGGLPAPETKDLKIGVSGLGTSYLGMLAAVDTLNQDGWNIEVVELASGDLMVQGVDSGAFQLGVGSMPSVMIAVEKDRPMKMYMDLIGLDWTAYGKAGISDCKDLQGKKYAVHSESSITNLLPRYWIEQNCAGTKPDWMIIPGSGNRLIALEAGEIDATTMELADAVQLNVESGGKYEKIAIFRDELPGIIGATHFGNSDFMAANPGTMANFAAAMLTAQRSFSDPAVFKAAFLKYLPDDYKDGPVLDEIVKEYGALELFAPDGGFTVDAMEKTVDFYQQAGVVGDGLTAAELMDRGPLDTALKALG